MENKKKKILVVIAGPTAVGKTALSVELAKYFKSEIISADSRQFYREMEIGTAKPDLGEMQGIQHHFINSHSIDEEYNAGRFENDTLILLQKLFTIHDILFLVGGSGMYIKAVTEGLDELPLIDPVVRKELNTLKDDKGIQVLQQMLKEVDPVYFGQVDLSNPQRLIRAIEVSKVSGRPYSEFRKKENKQRPFRVIKIGIELERQILYDRIDARMDAMLAKGLLAEAKTLYPKKSMNALQTVGYKEIFDFLDGIHSWEHAVELLKRNSRRYAKRQLTWFRQDPDYRWYTPQDVDKIIAELESELSAS